MTSISSEDNPWITRSERQVYDNPWISVTHCEVTTPAGTPGQYGVVHFKNLAIGILAIDSDGRVVLVGQYRYPLKHYSWEIPEGGCPIAEDPLAGAQRELREETGLTASCWSLVGSMHLSNSVSDEKCLIYLATDLKEGHAQPEETEKLAVKRLPIKEALAMVLRGEITDSLTVFAFLKAFHLPELRSYFQS